MRQDHMLSEEDIVYLNDMRINNPEAYARKLKILGMRDEEIPRLRDECEIYLMGGKPYSGVLPPGYRACSAYSDDGYLSDGILYLIDGDNHVYLGTGSSIDSMKADDKVRVFVSQEGLKKKLDSIDNIDVIAVRPGDQAVDNQIKNTIVEEVKDRKYQKIYVVSQDKGYDDFIEKIRKEYHLNIDELMRKVCVPIGARR